MGRAGCKGRCRHRTRCTQSEEAPKARNEAWFGIRRKGARAKIKVETQPEDPSYAGKNAPAITAGEQSTATIGQGEYRADVSKGTGPGRRSRPCMFDQKKSLQPAVEIDSAKRLRRLAKSTRQIPASQGHSSEGEKGGVHRGSPAQVIKRFLGEDHCSAIGAGMPMRKPGNERKTSWEGKHWSRSCEVREKNGARISDSPS